MTEIAIGSEMAQSPEMQATTELTVAVEDLLKAVGSMSPLDQSSLAWREMLTEDGNWVRRMHGWGRRFEAVTKEDSPNKIAYTIIKDYSTTDSASEIFTWDTDTAVKVGAKDRHGQILPDRSGSARVDQIKYESKWIKGVAESVATKLAKRKETPSQGLAQRIRARKPRGDLTRSSK